MAQGSHSLGAGMQGCRHAGVLPCRGAAMQGKVGERGTAWLEGHLQGLGRWVLRSGVWGSPHREVRVHQ